jgi:hypothetical protein
MDVGHVIRNVGLILPSSWIPREGTKTYLLGRDYICPELFARCVPTYRTEWWEFWHYQAAALTLLQLGALTVSAAGSYKCSKPHLCMIGQHRQRRLVQMIKPHQMTRPPHDQTANDDASKWSKPQRQRLRMIKPPWQRLQMIKPQMTTPPQKEPFQR